MGKKRKLQRALASGVGGANVFCSEIAAIVSEEISLGNRIAQAPEHAGWPEAESVFGSLAEDFRTDIHHPPAHVSYSVCNDPHYGWYGEYYCNIHKHLLVAGKCRHK